MLRTALHENRFFQIARVLFVLAISAVLLAASLMASAPPASAEPMPSGATSAPGPVASAATALPLAAHPHVTTVTAGCAGGRCTVYLNKSETAALGSGRVPAPPAFVAGPLRVAYYALAYGHRFFASQYAARGWCSGFRLSSFPWESQGYFGYRC